MKMIYLTLFFLLGCTLNNSTEQKAAGSLEKEVLQKDSIECLPFFSKYQKMFRHKGLKSFDVDMINESLKKDDLVIIDSLEWSEIFYQVDGWTEYRKAVRFYYFSLEKPFNNLQPIIILQRDYICEKSLIYLLFNSKGKLLSQFICSSDISGCGGDGFLNTNFINDSILSQNSEYREYGVDPETDEDIWQKTIKNVVKKINHDGSISIVETKEEIKKGK